MAINNFTSSANRMVNSALQRTPNARNLQQVPDTLRKGVDEGARRIQESSQAAQGRATVALAVNKPNPKTAQIMDRVQYLYSRSQDRNGQDLLVHNEYRDLRAISDVFETPNDYDKDTRKKAIGTIVNLYHYYNRDFKNTHWAKNFKNILDDKTGAYGSDIKKTVVEFVASSYAPYI